MLHIDLNAPGQYESERLERLVQAIKDNRKSARVYTHTVVVSGDSFTLSTTVKDIALNLASFSEEARQDMVVFFMLMFKTHSCTEMMLGYDPKHVPGSSKKDGPQGLHIAVIGSGNTRFQLSPAH